MMTEYLIAIAAIFAVNLLPAFGPPTWSILVVLALAFDLDPLIIVPAGAVAAACGRFTLATGARHFRGRLRPESRANLEAARALLAGNERRAWAGLGLFALSPLPSAQLFIAAGLLEVPLVPVTLAFFAGRLVSYTIYVTGAGFVAESMEEILKGSLGSPLVIGVQLAMLAALVALVRVDWAKLLARRGKRPDKGPTPGVTT